MTFRNLTSVAAILAAGAIGAPAFADDMALVISNSKILEDRPAGQIRRGHDELVALYRASGYTVLSGENLSRAEIQNLLNEMVDGLVDDPTGRAVVHYSGAAVSVGDKVLVLPEEPGDAENVDLLFNAIPLDVFVEAAKLRREGTVILALNAAADEDLNAKAAQPDDLPVSDDVLMISGVSRFVNQVVSESFLEKGMTATEVADSTSDVTMTGRVNSRTTLSDGVDVSDSSSEDVMWTLALEADNNLLVRAYLDRFPNGKYADEARRKLDAKPGESVELAMNLTNDEKRAIQQKLTILGYDTRGIDGIFGSGTRSSISKWQKTADFEETGFVSAQQLRRLERDAERRADEIREEERQLRQADNEYWRSTGRSGEEADLRTYLKKYPSGNHAEEAKDALAKIEQKSLRIANREDRDAWNKAKEANTPRAYNNYLSAFPNGTFAAEASARIADRQNNNTAEMLAAENALGLNGASLAVLELRLASLGLDTGPTDGKITDQTRRAIAQFQTSQGVKSTGYLTQRTMQRLILSGF